MLLKLRAFAKKMLRLMQAEDQQDIMKVRILFVIGFNLFYLRNKLYHGPVWVAQSGNWFKMI